MSKKASIILTVTAIALLICAGLVLYHQYSGGDSPEPPTNDKYTIEVHSEGGLPLENVGVLLYSDENRTKLLANGKTDKGGKVSFDIEVSDEHIIVLENLPDGYVTEAQYKANYENNFITLETALPDPDASRIFENGSIISDFTVTASDGNSYKISELLEAKKAVVLNFWFLNCGPCRMEFPYMQEAYEDYKDDIEILAINPVDGTEESIAQFASELGLTFPMAVGRDEWNTSMQLQAFPTTVVIDRYGTICMMHKGSITDKETFTRIFEFFTADNYQTKIVKNISDIR